VSCRVATQCASPRHGPPSREHPNCSTLEEATDFGGTVGLPFNCQWGKGSESKKLGKCPYAHTGTHSIDAEDHGGHTHRSSTRSRGDGRQCGSLVECPSVTFTWDTSSRRVIPGRVRLRAETCVPHKCLCGADICSLGLHGLSSRRSKGRWSRHGAANDVIARALTSGGVPSIKEPPGCSRADGKRPDGLTLVPWKRGRPLVWDFTCADTFAPSHVVSTATHRGYEAEEASEAKKRKYGFLSGA